ncbi:MAG: hypothetical protein AMXMBFR61_12690 [Fimbriimonadales bacterium]
MPSSLESPPITVVRLQGESLYVKLVFGDTGEDEEAATPEVYDARTFQPYLSLAASEQDTLAADPDVFLLLSHRE